MLLFLFPESLLKSQRNELSIINSFDMYLSKLDTLINLDKVGKLLIEFRYKDNCHRLIVKFIKKLLEDFLQAI